jgi:hypothetical protein
VFTGVPTPTLEMGTVGTVILPPMAGYMPVVLVITAVDIMELIVYYGVNFQDILVTANATAIVSIVKTSLAAFVGLMHAAYIKAITNVVKARIHILYYRLNTRIIAGQKVNPL